MKNKIVQGMEDAVAYAKGDAARATPRIPERVDVKAIRRKLGLTQPAFALRYGLSVAAIRDWEQGRRQPERPARVLLHLIEKDPEGVGRMLVG